MPKSKKERCRTRKKGDKRKTEIYLSLVRIRGRRKIRTLRTHRKRERKKENTDRTLMSTDICPNDNPNNTPSHSTTSRVTESQLPNSNSGP